MKHIQRSDSCEALLVIIIDTPANKRRVGMSQQELIVAWYLSVSNAACIIYKQSFLFTRNPTANATTVVNIVWLLTPERGLKAPSPSALQPQEVTFLNRFFRTSEIGCIGNSTLYSIRNRETMECDEPSMYVCGVSSFAMFVMYSYATIVASIIFKFFEGEICDLLWKWKKDSCRLRFTAARYVRYYYPNNHVTREVKLTVIERPARDFFIAITFVIFVGWAFLSLKDMSNAKICSPQTLACP